jgi:hypothetical protein
MRDPCNFEPDRWESLERAPKERHRQSDENARKNKELQPHLIPPERNAVALTKLTPEVAICDNLRVHSHREVIGVAEGGADSAMPFSRLRTVSTVVSGEN